MADTRRLDRAHGAGWLTNNEPATLQAVPDRQEARPRATPENRRRQSRSLDDRQQPTSHAEVTVPMRRVWLLLGLTLITAAAITGIGIRSVTGHTDTAAVIPTITATTPASTTPTVPTTPACTGLSGTLVTDTQVDSSTAVGVIAAFEHAYYRLRDARAAMALVAVEAGLIEDVLAGGISSIPVGTTYCVAITPIAETAAEVHLVQLGPDGTRIDYLQLINTRRAPHGQYQITHFQARG